MKLLILSVCVALVSCDVSHIVKSPEQEAKIVAQQQDVGLEGQFSYSFETENKISAAAQGTLKDVGAEVPASEISGESSYVNPEGETVQLRYIANENGYQPEGSHIPTPPPIPEPILRALEYIRAHPPPAEPQLKN